MNKRFLFSVVIIFLLIFGGIAFSEETIIWQFNWIPESNEKITFGLLAYTDESTADGVIQIIDDRCFFYGDLIEKRYSIYREQQNGYLTGDMILRYKLSGPGTKIKLIQREIEKFLEARKLQGHKVVRKDYNNG